MDYRLSQLEAQLYRLNADRGWSPVDRIEEAQAIQFLCPKCFEKNGGNVGTHLVHCSFKDRGLPADIIALYGPGSWRPRGSTIEDITFYGGEGEAFSVKITKGCEWHGFIRNGVAVTE